MHVVATAGHVDHGKSTLIKELTGTDPDRLSEEKRRGLTIDLGFAWLDLPRSGRVSIIDVPGHERFIRNMLAGVGSVGCVIFVVSATEGWKPQSEEHLQILDLLGVSSGVIAITRCAEVSDERLEDVETQVAANLAGTSLAAAPIVKVAAIEGVGMERLRHALDESLVTKDAAPDLGRPRLWVDRVFTMKGSGTVVTGTLTDGWLRSDEEVEAVPSGRRARVRALQSQNRSVPDASPGSRLAMNLSGVSVTDLARGDVLSTIGTWPTTRSILAKVRILKGYSPAVLRKGAFKVHLGSAAADAVLRPLGAWGEDTVGGALIRLSRDLPIQAFDRFVIRESGRRATVGGGVVLDPAGDQLGLSDRELRAAYDARRDAETPTRMLRVVLEQGPLPRHVALIRAGEATNAAMPQGITDLGESLVLEDQVTGAVAEIESQVDAHHLDSPMETGLALSSLRERLNSDLADRALFLLRSAGKLIIEDGFARRPSHEPRSQTPEAQELIELLNSSGGTPPAIAELRERFGHALVAAVEREGAAVRVSDQLLFSASWLEQLQQSLRAHVVEHGKFTVAEFRDMVGTTRKFAVPLLEHLDRKRVTLRSGDHRTMGPNA